MRATFVQSTSATGGTGDLALVTANGAPRFDQAFQTKRWVEYAITEWNTSRTTILRNERGYTQVDPAGPTLLRSGAKVIETWDGSVFNNTTAVTLSFGSTAANIDIICAPTAGSAMPSMPFIVAVGGRRLLGAANLLSNTSTSATLSGVNTIYWNPFQWVGDFAISAFQWIFSTATTTGSAAMVGIYEVASSGVPGRLIADLTAVTKLSTTITTAQVITTFTPFYLPPGWYWVAFAHNSTASTYPAVPYSSSTGWTTLGGISNGTLFGTISSSSSYSAGLPADGTSLSYSIGNFVTNMLCNKFAMGY